MEEKVELIDYSVIDSLKSFEEDDEGFFKEIMTIYLLQSDEIIKSIKVKHSEGKTEDIKALAHKLKGSCLNIGASKVAGLCQLIEKEIKNDNISGLEKFILELETASNETNEKLKEL